MTITRHYGRGSGLIEHGVGRLIHKRLLIQRADWPQHEPTFFPIIRDNKSANDR